MEFTKEFIEANKLSDEQATAIKTFAEDHIATLKNQWDGKANENAESILEGAVTHFQKQNKIDIKREQGEKYGDYIKRATSTLLANERKAVEDLKTEYDTKIKEFKGGDATKAELDKAKKDLDDALIKLADYDDLKEKASKYEETTQTLSKLKLQLAFNNIKPNFPKEVNEYEAAAKWEMFKNAVLKEYNIEMDGEKAVAVSKENKHKVKDLSDLLKADTAIQALMAGRQQGGSGAEPKEMVSIKDVPFEVPKGATTKDISKLIQEHLIKAGIPNTHPEYSKRFAELNRKILMPEKASA